MTAKQAMELSNRARDFDDVTPILALIEGAAKQGLRILHTRLTKGQREKLKDDYYKYRVARYDGVDYEETGECRIIW